MDFFRHLRLLLWKNALLKWRTPFTTLAEIILPVLITLVLVALRSAVSSDDIEFSLRVSDSQIFNESIAIRYIREYPQFKNKDNPCSYKLAFAPSPAVDPLAQTFTALHPELFDCVKLYPSLEGLNDYIRSDDYGRNVDNPYLITVVALNQAGYSNNQWDYSLWMNSTATGFNDQIAILPDTKTIDPVNILQWEYDDEYWTRYMSSSLIFLQNFVETYIVQTAITGTQVIPPSQWPNRVMTANPMPTPSYIHDNFASVISGFVGLLFTIVFLLPVTRVIKLIVEEKELRIREGMKMMGLSTSALWISWLITYFVIYVIISILITAVTSSNLFEYSNKGLIFFFFLLFQLTTFSFAFMFSTFFSTARLASTFGALVFLVSFFPYYAVQDKSESESTKTAACLSTTVCFTLGMVNIVNREAAQVGIQNNNTNDLYYNFSYSRAIGMMFLDFFLYLFVGLYLDRVVPGQWGTPLPWYFPFTKSYWFPKKHAPLAQADGANDVISNPLYEPVHFDDDTQHSVGVRIRKLRKQFKTDDPEPFVAVNDISLDMYTGQIFALLGHNGAGKTTTINMLSGMLPPTSGQAQVFGYNVVGDMPQIRQILGVCPQHNVLFDLLTVKEHLEFFASIKGLRGKELDAVVMDMIKQVGLEEKVNVKSAALSGGMQRKLSVGIALIGDSKIVFLDEPTSGMDPYSRRATWDLLKKKKEGRVIILTTHFMDEADQLGDRVAIMAHGDVQCCGSPLFLKNKYGVGYTLTIVKKSNFNEEAVRECVSQHVPESDQLSNIAGEISFRLPLHASSTFAPMFDAIDEHQSSWGVDTYSVSVTTLEEVFLRVSSEPVEGKDKINTQNHNQSHDHQNGHDNSIHPPPPSYDSVGESSNTVHVKPAQTPVTVNPLKSPTSSMSYGAEPIDTARTEAYKNVTFDKSNMFLTLIRALLIKRWCNAKRNLKSWTWTTIIPTVVLLIFIGVLKAANDTQRPPFYVNYADFNQPLPFPLAVHGTYANHPYPPYSNSVVNTLNISAAELNENVWTVNTFTNASADDPLKFAEWMWDTWPQRDLTVYGGLLYASTLSTSNPTWSDNTNVFFNTTGLYSLPIYYNAYNEALLRSVTANTASISYSLIPFPVTQNLEALMNSLYAIAIGIAFAFVPASFIHYAVKERTVKSKHQQMISGVSPLTYWLANFIWDYVNYIFPCILLIIVLYIYGITELLNKQIDVTIVALIIFGFSVIPFVYFLSFFFSSHTGAQNFILIAFIVLGAFLPIASVILDTISSTSDINSHLKFVYRLAPPFCLIEIFSNLLTMGSSSIFPTKVSRWDFDVAGFPMIYMAAEGFVYMMLVLAIEYVIASPSLFTFFTKQVNMPKRTFDDEDVDVIAERDRLKATSGPVAGENITIRGLRKVYAGRLGSGAKTAVHDLFLGIEDGECFGFLGINGAGKTTTMKMLTSDIYPTEGEAYLAGMNALSQQQEVRNKIGYCPQFDALIGTLTAREHLMLFARIKGVKESTIPEYVEILIEKLGLQEGIADRPCKGYSGGNKRKLCVGIALIGNPPIVFLDEPTTGVDPMSRRFMWNLIASTMKGRSVILTTHSMEESEALCQRIGVMVSGRLRCLGTASQLKSRYGNGWQLDINLPGREYNDSFVELLQNTYNREATLIERHDQSQKWRIPKNLSDGKHVAISDVFRFIEQMKAKMPIQEYSVSETTLEQIFIHFARQQEEETGEVAGLVVAQPDGSVAAAHPNRAAITNGEGGAVNHV
jgi:ATP-binding cassette subfamily A (ABC1) protein 3